MNLSYIYSDFVGIWPSTQQTYDAAKKWYDELMNGWPKCITSSFGKMKTGNKCQLCGGHKWFLFTYKELEWMLHQHKLTAMHKTNWLTVHSVRKRQIERQNAMYTIYIGNEVPEHIFGPTYFHIENIGENCRKKIKIIIIKSIKKQNIEKILNESAKMLNLIKYFSSEFILSIVTRWE